MSAKSVHPFLSYADDRPTDRLTDRQTSETHNPPTLVEVKIKIIVSKGHLLKFKRIIIANKVQVWSGQDKTAQTIDNTKHRSGKINSNEKNASKHAS